MISSNKDLLDANKSPLDHLTFLSNEAHSPLAPLYKDSSQNMNHNNNNVYSNQ